MLLIIFTTKGFVFREPDAVTNVLGKRVLKSNLLVYGKENE